MTTMRKLSLVLFGLVILAAPPVLAQRTNPLDGQPEVRKRMILRDGRFELAPQIGFALNRDFYHTIMFGAKAEYHINDWISVGANFGYGAVNVRTGLADNVLGQLPDNYDSSTAKQLIPSKAMAENPMLKLNMLIGAQANVTPFFGKMALFSKLFFNYDFYGFLGFGAAMYGDKCGTCSYTDSTGNSINYANPSIHDVNGSKGNPFKPGLTFGAGFHFFFNNWVALNAEIRDTAIPNVNLAGRDINWDPQRAASGSLLPPLVNKSDKQWDHILTVLLGCSFYLPTTVSITR
jgi:outer membrane beta-barrel protein